MDPRDVTASRASRDRGETPGRVDRMDSRVVSVIADGPELVDARVDLEQPAFPVARDPSDSRARSVFRASRAISAARACRVREGLVDLLGRRGLRVYKDSKVLLVQLELRAKLETMVLAELRAVRAIPERPESKETPDTRDRPAHRVCAVRPDIPELTERRVSSVRPDHRDSADLPDRREPPVCRDCPAILERPARRELSVRRDSRERLARAASPE